MDKQSYWYYRMQHAPWCHAHSEGLGIFLKNVYYRRYHQYKSAQHA